MYYPAVHKAPAANTILPRSAIARIKHTVLDWTYRIESKEITFAAIASWHIHSREFDKPSNNSEESLRLKHPNSSILPLLFQQLLVRSFFYHDRIIHISDKSSTSALSAILMASLQNDIGMARKIAEAVRAENHRLIAS